MPDSFSDEPLKPLYDRAEAAGIGAQKAVEPYAQKAEAAAEALKRRTPTAKTNPFSGGESIRLAQKFIPQGVQNYVQSKLRQYDEPVIELDQEPQQREPVQFQRNQVTDPNADRWLVPPSTPAPLGHPTEPEDEWLGMQSLKDGKGLGGAPTPVPGAIPRPPLTAIQPLPPPNFVEITPEEMAAVHAARTPPVQTPTVPEWLQDYMAPHSEHTEAVNKKHAEHLVKRFNQVQNLESLRK